jgi:hypothetical protein
MMLPLVLCCVCFPRSWKHTPHLHTVDFKMCDDQQDIIIFFFWEKISVHSFGQSLCKAMLLFSCFVNFLQSEFTHLDLMLQQRIHVKSDHSSLPLCEYRPPSPFTLWTS